MATLDDHGSPGSEEKTGQAVAEPLLHDGQRLDQPTFHELYSRMPDDFRAELIDGVVYIMNMPVFEDHGRSDLEMAGILYIYSMYTPGTIAQANTTTLLDLQSEVQPDSALRIDPAYGGQTVRDERGRTTGCPELVVEIGSSSLRIDLNAKKQAYEKAGALEYIVFDVPHQKFHWSTRRDGRFEPLSINADGLYRSLAFPGLWINVQAFLEGDKTAVFESLRRGSESPEHTDFVARLARNRANRP